MKIVIVPNSLRDEIYARIDKVLDGRLISDSDREIIYSLILAYFDEHGVIPDFNLEKRLENV